MPERLTPLEVSLLALDTPDTPAHVGTVSVFEPGPAMVDDDRLLALVSERISFVPRYRQRVRDVWARLAAPVWVDDEEFDLTFHLRRTTLPAPGTPEQLHELAARVFAQRLDRSRPPWEVHLVTGLEHGRFALLTKSHLSLVDGIDAVELGQVLLDVTPESQPPPLADWRRVPEPTPVELLVGAAWQSVQDPAVAVQNGRGLVGGAVGLAVAVGDAVGGVGAVLGELADDARRGRRPPADSAVTGSVSALRRVALVSLPLADLKAVGSHYGHPVHDVVLAVVTGGLRAWLLARGEPLTLRSSLAALVPMSVTEEGDQTSSLGSTVAPHRQRLPVGEPSPVLRLGLLALRTRAHRDTGRAVGARSLAGLAGFAPATVHALGARLATDVARPHDLLITNVPGPQQPLYAAGARLLASYPVLPLTPGHRLAVGVTSYDGQVFLGLTGDGDALSDLDVLASGLADSLAELVEAADPSTGPDGGWRLMGQMVFISCSRAQAHELRGGGGALPVTGCAATESLLRAHNYSEEALEDAEYAALGFAGVQAVLTDGDPLRLVLAADVASASVSVVPGSEHGAVAVRALRWAEVRALFSDEAGAAAAVAAARGVASGQSLVDALALPEVEALLEEHDLLWYAPEELDSLPGA